MLTAGAIAVLFGFWVLLSGFFTPFLLGAGLVSAVVVVVVTRRMGVLDSEGHALHLAVRALTYWPWLIWEVVKSAWDVTKLIVDPKLPISPTLLTVTATQRTPLGITIYANSITLTPGTISVELTGNAILVHAITRGGADGLAGGDMDRRATIFEGTA